MVLLASTRAIAAIGVAVVALAAAGAAHAGNDTCDDAQRAAQAKHVTWVVVIDDAAHASAVADTPTQLRCHVDAGAVAAKRYVVLAVPTVIVMREDGSEIDRIEGAHDAAALAHAIAALPPSVDVVASLQAQARAATRVADRAHLTLAIARKKLVRGDASALESLERIAIADDDDAAQEALFIMANDLERVAHDASAPDVWRELALRFPHGPHAAEATIAYASALHAQGRDALAQRVLDRRLALARDDDVAAALARMKGGTP